MNRHKNNCSIVAIKRVTLPCSFDVVFKTTDLCGCEYICLPRPPNEYCILLSQHLFAILGGSKAPLGLCSLRQLALGGGVCVCLCVGSVY
jgi:hypothetical protein